MNHHLPASSSIKALALALVFFIPAPDAPAATVIYGDTFDGGAVDLNGRTTTVGSGTWSSTTGSAQTWLQNGTLLGSETNNTIANALLPFTPTAGNIYELSLTASMSGSSSGWVALGFTANSSVAGTNITANSFAASGTNGAALWMLKRSADNTAPASPNQTVSFSGVGTAGSVSLGTFGDPQNLKLVLNTTSNAWSAEWFVNGTSVRTFEYLTNPTISYVGVSLIQGTATGTPIASIDNFQLSVIPEPSTSALILAASCAAFVFFRRRLQH